MARSRKAWRRSLSASRAGDVHLVRGLEVEHDRAEARRAVDPVHDGVEERRRGDPEDRGVDPQHQYPGVRRALLVAGMLPQAAFSSGTRPMVSICSRLDR